MNFDLERFLSVLHSIGGGAFILFYILMADGWGHKLYMCLLQLTYDVCVHDVCASDTTIEKDTNRMRIRDRKFCV